MSPVFAFLRRLFCPEQAPVSIDAPAHDLRGKDGQRVFLVLVDDSLEVQAAIRYVAGRVQNEKSRIILMSVAPTPEQSNWMFVGSRMQAEARQKAEERLAKAANDVHRISNTFPQLVLREGIALQEVLGVLKEYLEITVMVVASRLDGEDMACLVKAATSAQETPIPVPVTIIPGFLAPQEVDALY